MSGLDRKVKFLLVVLTIGLVVSLFESALTLSGYSIEIELGASLEPYLGRGAVLLVSRNPEHIYAGDFVTVYAPIMSQGEGITLVRKMVKNISVEWDAITDTVHIWIYLVDGKGNSWGWHPVSAVRGKVQVILFRGF